MLHQLSTSERMAVDASLLAHVRMVSAARPSVDDRLRIHRNSVYDPKKLENERWSRQTQQTRNMQMLERFGRITARDSQFPVNHPPHVISPATVRRSQAAGTIRDANWKMLGRLSRVQTNYPQREMLESARQHEEWRRARARFPSNKLPRGAAGSRAQTPSRVPPLGLGVPHTTDPYLQDLMTPYPSGTMSARHSSRPQSSARTLTANHMAPPSARSAVPGHGPVAARQAPSRMRPSSEGPQGRSRSQPRAVSASRPRASSVHSSDGMPFRATGRNASPLNARAFFGQPVAPNGAAHPASQRSVRYEGESARARASVEAEVDDDSAAHERSAGAPRPRSRFDDLPTLARGGPSAGAQPRQPPSWSAGARGGSAVGDAAGAGSGAWLAARSPAMAGSRAPLAPPSGVPLQSSPQATAALPDGMLEQASLDAAGARERAGGTGAVFHDVAANGMPLSAYDDVVASSGRQVDYAQAMPASASRPAPSIDAAPSQSRVAVVPGQYYDASGYFCGQHGRLTSIFVDSLYRPRCAQCGWLASLLHEGAEVIGVSGDAAAAGSSRRAHRPAPPARERDRSPPRVGPRRQGAQHRQTRSFAYSGGGGGGR